MKNRAGRLVLAVLFLVTLVFGSVGWMQDDIGESVEPNYTKMSRVEIGESDRGLIDSASRVIVDSCGTLDGLYDKMFWIRSGAEGLVSMVHIGDSHVQGGMWTRRVRELLMEEFDSGGRGVVAPYKLAKMNEPKDYAITTQDRYRYSRVSSSGEAEPQSFSTVAIEFEQDSVVVRLWAKMPFSSVKIIHSDAPIAVCVIDSLSMITDKESGERTTRIELKNSVDTLDIHLSRLDPLQNIVLYGLVLESGEGGVVYHEVGLNGAAFEHFLNGTTLPLGGAQELSPDLLIVSLGTNNSYGAYYDKARFKRVVERFVNELKENYPTSAILLTTPRDSGVRVRRGVYGANKNVKHTAQAIIEVAQESGLAYLDLYSRCGDIGGSERWVRAGLMRADRIHMSERGYLLLGDLLYNSLADGYNGWIEHTQRANKGGDAPYNTPDIENQTEQ